MFGNNDVEKSLKTIKEALESKDKTIETLRKENNYLKNEYDKDKEIAKLKQQLEEARKDNRRGFPISEAEDKAITEWQEAHIKKKHWDKHHNCPKSFGAIGGNFTYEFTPTSIGIIGTVKCSCGESFDFQEL